jgi:hypothetical protein
MDSITFEPFLSLAQVGCQGSASQSGAIVASYTVSGSTVTVPDIDTGTISGSIGAYTIKWDGGDTFTTQAQVVVDGDCTASDGCVRSANYPSSYGANEGCSISFNTESVWFTPTSFATEYGNDILTVDGTQYSDEYWWPGDDPFEVRSSISWSSDHEVQNAGWEFCVVSDDYD